MSSTSDWTVRETSLADLRRIARIGLSRQHARVFATQLTGPGVALERDGKLVAMGGLWPLDGYVEGWFMVTQEARRPEALLRVLRVARAALDRADGGLPITVAVADRNTAGRRLAQAAGFIDAGPHPLAAGVTMFVLAPR